jgi:hypothetical protein
MQGEIAEDVPGGGSDVHHDQATSEFEPPK